MTREEIDKVIEKAENNVLRFPVEDIEWGRNKLPYFAEMQDLLSAVKQLREDRQWQPIETAPRDGRPILLMKNGELFTARYIDGEYGHGWCTPDGNEIFHPTYWMPSPDVPQDFINDRIEKGRR